MAKVEKGHFDTDIAYLQGMEDFCNIIKAVFELTYEERIKMFGVSHVSMILDKFDFQQIREKMMNPIKTYYVIRGIKVDDEGFKQVVAESDRLEFKPDEMFINIFLNCHKDKHPTFAVIEEIYVRK